MSEEEPSRLATLRFLRRVQVQQLEQTDRWIQAEEQRTAADEARPAPAPPPTGWVVEPSDVQDHLPTLHRGGCTVAKRRLRPVSSEVARRALSEQIVEACEVCRPEAELGV